MTRRASLSDSLDAHQAPEVRWEPPADLPALTKAERAAWDQYVADRREWTHGQLRMLHHAVKAETAWIDALEVANNADALSVSGQGAVMVHPAQQLVRDAQKRCLDLLRYLGLNTRPSNSTVASKGAAAVRDTHGAKNGKKKLLRGL